MNSRIIVVTILMMITASSCKVVPFFMPKDGRDDREEKRIERLEERKRKAQYKLDVGKGKEKRKIKKIEKIESKLPGDSIVVGLDSASLAKTKEDLANVIILKKKQTEALKIFDVNKINFKTVKLKTKMKFVADGQKQAFTAHFQIEKDKAIWINISAVLGLQVGRALITPDRVQAMNKLNNEYYDYSFDELVKLINVNLDFASLQEIIVGNAIGVDGEVFELTDFGGTINIGVKSSDFLNKLTYNKSDSTLRQIQLQVFRGSYASNILGMLGEYQKELGRLVPTKRIYNVEDSKGKLSLEMEVNKIEFDKELNMPYTVPKNFKKAE